MKKSLAVLLLVGCGTAGAFDGGSTGFDCPSLAAALCNKAASCARLDGGVQLIYAAQHSDDVFASLGGCTSFFTRGCVSPNTGSSGFDAGGCQASIAGTMCGTSNEGPGLIASECYGLK
jgi:hypothetical protein